jgi:hypothetical protein
MKTFEIWLAFNEDGDAVASFDSGADARALCADDCGGEIIRVVKLNVAATLPVVSEVSVTVPHGAQAFAASAE